MRAAGETNVMAGADGVDDGVGISVGEGAARGWISLKQPRGTTDAGKNVGKSIAIEPTAFDDGCEHLGVELGETLRTPPQRGAVAPVTEAMAAAVAVRDAPGHGAGPFALRRS